MGWLSGKKPVYKFNPLRIGKSVQEDFFHGHVRLNKRQMRELQQHLGGDILKSGKLMTASEFQKAITAHDPALKTKWQEFIKQKDAEYEQYLDQQKQENIKRVRMMDRKREAADKMVEALTGRENPESWRDKLKRQVTAERSDLKATQLTRKEQRVLKKQTELIKRQKTQWDHAEKNKSATVHDARRTVWDETKKRLEPGEEGDVEEAKEKSKNLPELQI